MTLMSRTTGEDIDDLAHLEQSIIDIVSTPLGSRVAVRDYGCLLYALVDKPVNRQWVIDGFSYIAEALARWEPRYALTRVLINASRLSEGIISLTLTGLYKPLGRVIVLENISVDFSAGTAGIING